MQIRVCKGDGEREGGGGLRGKEGTERIGNGGGMKGVKKS